MFFDNLIFSFFSSSWYNGFIINVDNTNTIDITKYVIAPSSPNPIAFPSIPANTTPNIGTEFPIHAAIILIPNGETCPPVPTPTIDVINDIIYNGMFCIENTFANTPAPLCFPFACPSFIFWNILTTSKTFLHALFYNLSCVFFVFFSTLF